jgi:hypothetical protein
MHFVNVGTDPFRAWVIVFLPQAAATIAVLAGFLGAVGIGAAPRPLRWLVLGGALVVLVAAYWSRWTENGTNLLASDLAGVVGLTLLVVTSGLKRMPAGLTRMARAAGAGWASVGFYAFLRPSALRLVACWGISLVLTAQDFGAAARLGVTGGIGPALALGCCAVLGLALLLGPRAAW